MYIMNETWRGGSCFVKYHEEIHVHVCCLLTCSDYGDDAQAHLHSKGIMHCDVKSLNFLVTHDFVIKLSDLGEARPIRASMSPEETKLMPK